MFICFCFTWLKLCSALFCLLFLSSILFGLILPLLIVNTILFFLYLFTVSIYISLFVLIIHITALHFFFHHISINQLSSQPLQLFINQVLTSSCHNHHLLYHLLPRLLRVLILHWINLHFLREFVKVIAAMDVENVNEGKSDVLKRNHIVPRVFD